MEWWVNNLVAIGGPSLVLAWTLWVVLSITLHELAHGWAAVWCGDRTPIETGHMTWNPVVHMGVPSLVLFALCGLAYGMMPVDPSRFRRWWHDAIVSLAGPLMNLAIAVFAVVVAGLAVRYGAQAGGQGAKVAVQLVQFMWWGAVLNLMLALFNLVPAPPLDGWRILGTFVPGYRRAFESEGGMLLGLVMLGVLFFYGGKFLLPIVVPAVERAILFIGGAPASAP